MVITMQSGGKVYAYVNGKVKYVGEFGECGEFEYQEKKGVIRSSWFGQGIMTLLITNGMDLSFQK